jgi:hypothetical protein
MCVLEEIKNRPGNFLFMTSENSKEHTIMWAQQLERDFKIITRLKAWDYLKTYNNIFWEINKHDPMFKLIISTIDEGSTHSGASLCNSLLNMSAIARLGWEQYKKSF